MKWLFWRGVRDRRQAPRLGVSTANDEALKEFLRCQVQATEDELRTLILELEAGVYARDTNVRGDAR